VADNSALLSLVAGSEGAESTVTTIAFMERLELPVCHIVRIQ